MCHPWIAEADWIVQPEDWSRADWEHYLATGEEPTGKSQVS